MTGNRILVIDDSNTNLVLLESLLQKNGYNVSSALSAMEGIENLKQNKPDLIFLDFLMPEIDGLQFLDMLHKNEDWKNIPVVILSAISDMDIIKQSKDKGVVDYITKPISIDRIIELTRSILSN
jgi:twitching motility two-component system response regulator PilH